MFRTKNYRLIMQSKCPVCGIKKPRFMKEQEVKGLLSNLEIRTPLSKIPLLNVFLNEIVNRFLLVGDKFMSEMHLKQPGFTYSACGPFTKNKERIEKFMQTGNTNFIYKNELDKSCFQHAMAHGKNKRFSQKNSIRKIF